MAVENITHEYYKLEYTYSLGNKRHTLNILFDTEYTLVGVFHAHTIPKNQFFHAIIEKSKLIVEGKKSLPIITALNNYFAGTLSEFAIQYSYIYGSEFQRKVWNYLATIPINQFASYKQISQAINCSKATRAVGSAVGSNPLSIVLPCHRVIQSHNIKAMSQNLNIQRVGKYHGGSELKYQLLLHEHKHFF